jgi:hypothetical protein
MSGKLEPLLDRITNWKVISILFVVFGVFTFKIFPALSRRLESKTGESPPTLDARFSYSPEAAYRIIDGLGPQGRKSYAIVALTLDLLYPLVYTLLFILSIYAIFRRTFPSKLALRKLAFLPLGMLAADYLENFSIAVLLLRYPQRLPALARSASLFTGLKWVFTIINLGVIFVGLATFLIFRFKGWIGTLKT